MLAATLFGKCLVPKYIHWVHTQLHSPYQHRAEARILDSQESESEGESERWIKKKPCMLLLVWIVSATSVGCSFLLEVPQSGLSASDNFCPEMHICMLMLCCMKWILNTFVIVPLVFFSLFHVKEKLSLDYCYFDGSSLKQINKDISSTTE